MGWFVVLALVAGGGYLISLRLHPFRQCSACCGLLAPGRHHGALFGYAHRRCKRCGGTNRQERLGVRLGLAGPRERMGGKGRGGP